MATPKLDINLAGLELLVVEDDATSALLISRALSKYGAKVEIAVNGIAGLQQFQERRFSIVVTDINMPGMNGLELVDRIRAFDKDTQMAPRYPTWVTRNWLLKYDRSNHDTGQIQQASML
jgi:CheY-like chemotaxis protein